MCATGVKFAAILAFSVFVFFVLWVKKGVPTLFLLLLQGNNETGQRNAKESFILAFILCDLDPDPMLALSNSTEIQFLR